ncbi:DUF6715 family protein [Kineothrix sp. MB12-C1]|uniref:DUF6715 family protein n=1 Tax=Kineothrix sp. MB12-C1 TaxID=3070215 RepID=UPI0027D31A3F|nr:DUF6715 family protein [Kineothrix sp. MB12-C1]WMC93698.1 hypothetical protein RBB56_05420 [Kineothrix sp. MB12-C1]
MAQAGKGKESGSTAKLVIIGVILAALLVGFYYYVSNKGKEAKEEEVGKVTKTQQILQYNFDQKYPPSPKEVVKYYSEITQCFYNEDNSQEDIEALANQIQKLYDEELIANQGDNYLDNLKDDIYNMKESQLVISSYSTSASTDVEYYTKDDYEWASLYCVYSMRQGTTMLNSSEKFLLRKDAQGHWKIYGWTLVNE